MQSKKERREDSDSEDDPDYVPPRDAVDCSDDERDAKRVKVSSPKLTAEEEEEKKRAREALWASFQASVSSPQPAVSRTSQKKMVKIEKRHLFAGEEVVILT